jgi:hypothetical protein
VRGLYDSVLREKLVFTLGQIYSLLEALRMIEDSESSDTQKGSIEQNVFAVADPLGLLREVQHRLNIAKKTVSRMTQEILSSTSQSES